MSNKNREVKGIETIELNLTNKEDFLKWREEIIQRYEQNKIKYAQETRELLGYDEEEDE